MFSKGESIFQKIYRYSRENPNCIYEDQDYETSGLEDSYYIFFSETLPEKIQTVKAQNLLMLINNYLGDEAEHDNLFNFINEDRFITYYYEFCKLLKLYILENLIDLEKLADVGIKLAACSNSFEEIKLGITILGICKPENSKKIIDVLGMHSEFTFYAVTSTRNWDHYNSFVFNLAKKTYGYGKVHCLKNLYPINDEIKQWIIENGCHNVVLREISAIICTEKVDMSWYLESRDINKAELSKISMLLYYILSVKDNDIYELEDGVETVKVYMKYAEKYAYSFQDLCAVAYIETWMRPYLFDTEAVSKRKNGWTITIEKEIKNKCLDILKNNKWKAVLKESLKKTEEQGKTYIYVSKAIGLDLTFEDVLPILEKDNYNVDIYLFLSESKNENNIKELINYANMTLPFEEILCGAEGIDENDIATDYKPDICLFCILNNLNDYGFVDMDLPVRALQARFPKCREEAVYYLKKNKRNWDSETVSKIRQAMEVETSHSIKIKMERLIDENKINGNKAREYTDIRNIAVKSYFKDIYLFTTDVAGVLYRDTSVVENKIKINDLLYLKADVNNPYDENAVMVTSNKGYILGYLPRQFNKQPRNLLTGGKYLYGRLKECCLEDNHLTIDVYLSYQDVLESMEDIVLALGQKTNSLKQ
ncbi:MAG: hypothetical protein K0R54_1942 [Clostridiaceae bacterium]|jgi:hypothetical protein|nr:hypothetical protein [Clostridiaceae bacterium]